MVYKYETHGCASARNQGYVKNKNADMQKPTDKNPSGKVF